MLAPLILLVAFGTLFIFVIGCNCIGSFKKNARKQQSIQAQRLSNNSVEMTKG